MLRCRSPFRSLPSGPIRRTVTRMRCRTVAVHRHSYPSLWASTTLAVESCTDLFVASHWLERSSRRFSNFARSQSSRSHSQVLSTVAFISTFYWRLASKASKLIRPPMIGSTAVTSHAAINSDKCKKNCSLSTTYNGEMTHRKQQK